MFSKRRVKIKNRMANSVDPDEMAQHESSHLDLHCLQKCWFWSVGLKELIRKDASLCKNCVCTIFTPLDT